MSGLVNGPLDAGREGAMQRAAAQGFLGETK
jgi:hypothetical protein